MTFDPVRHHRRSIRLRDYEYAAPGAYFLTICAEGRACVFGDIVDGEMRPNHAGRTMADWFDELNRAFPGVRTDASIVMPNHFHAIVIVGADLCVRPDQTDRQVDPADLGTHAGVPLRVSLASVVQWFKTMTTNAYIRGVNDQGWPRFDRRLWQRNYYEHIVRNNIELERIREYIRFNPARWTEDRENPDATAVPRLTT